MESSDPHDKVVETQTVPTIKPDHIPVIEPVTTVVDTKVSVSGPEDINSTSDDETDTRFPTLAENRHSDPRAGPSDTKQTSAPVLEKTEPLKFNINAVEFKPPWSIVTPVVKVIAPECSVCKTDNLIVKIACGHLYCYPCLKGSFRPPVGGVGSGKCQCPVCRTTLPTTLWERATQRDLLPNTFLDNYIAKCKVDGITDIYAYSGTITSTNVTSGGWWLYQYNINKVIATRPQAGAYNSTLNLQITGRSFVLNLNTMKQLSNNNGRARSLKKFNVDDLKLEYIRGIAGVSK